MTVGIVCDDTCFGYGAGDDFPTQLFGTPFQNLGGFPFTLVQNADHWTLTINNTTRDFPLSDIVQTATGYELHTALINNFYGVAYEQQELCIPTSVPEPATWACLILGFALLAVAFRAKRRRACLSA